MLSQVPQYWRNADELFLLIRDLAATDDALREYACVRARVRVCVRMCVRDLAATDDALREYVCVCAYVRDLAATDDAVREYMCACVRVHAPQATLGLSPGTSTPGQAWVRYTSILTDININVKHRTSNIKHRTSNIKHQTSNIKH